MHSTRTACCHLYYTTVFACRRQCLHEAWGCEPCTAGGIGTLINIRTYTYAHELNEHCLGMHVPHMHAAHTRNARTTQTHSDGWWQRQLLKDMHMSHTPVSIHRGLNVWLRNELSVTLSVLSGEAVVAASVSTVVLLAACTSATMAVVGAWDAIPVVVAGVVVTVAVVNTVCVMPGLLLVAGLAIVAGRERGVEGAGTGMVCLCPGVHSVSRRGVNTGFRCVVYGMDVDAGGVAGGRVDALVAVVLDNSVRTRVAVAVDEVASNIVEGVALPVAACDVAVVMVGTAVPVADLFFWLCVWAAAGVEFEGVGVSNSIRRVACSAAVIANVDVGLVVCSDSSAWLGALVELW